MARPRTPGGAYGSIAVRRRGDRVIAETRIRDAHGRLRHVRVTSRTAAQARQVLRQRLLDPPTFGSTRVLTPQSSFANLVEVWLADLDVQRLAEGTKQNYRDQVRLHVLPEFEHYTLAEITTGRVEWFLKSQFAISSSRARQSRTLLNLLFGFAWRHDASILRRRATGVSEARTIFADRRGGPLSPHNVRRTFRDFLVEAGLGDSGISLRWYRRTGATVIARGMGSDAAAAFLGHSSTAITEGHYIERDLTVDRTPAAHLERTLRPVRPDDALLVQAAAAGEDALLAAVDHERDDDAVA